MSDAAKHPLGSAALDYLRAELGPRAPSQAMFEAAFDESPLEGEGPACLFSFELIPSPGAAACSETERRHFVVVGATTANYFPAYELSADDAYSFHIGTRFMLEMGVQRVDAPVEPPGARERLHAVLREVAAGARLSSPELAGLFRCEDDYFAVYRLSVNDESVYALGADCPPGFYRLTRYPPQTALRLHLGKLIREEARQARRTGQQGVS
ncbi:MAG: hypothetical protein HZB38_01160 [Planctomycetes bacterium]|nr:hypothetical protein [Planctomycetota bacterium]